MEEKLLIHISSQFDYLNIAPVKGNSLMGVERINISAFFIFYTKCEICNYDFPSGCKTVWYSICRNISQDQNGRGRCLLYSSKGNSERQVER